LLISQAWAENAPKPFASGNALRIVGVDAAIVHAADNLVDHDAL
jgi:hypothetical protein